MWIWYFPTYHFYATRLKVKYYLVFHHFIHLSMCPNLNVVFCHPTIEMPNNCRRDNIISLSLRGLVATQQRRGVKSVVRGVLLMADTHSFVFLLHVMPASNNWSTMDVVDAVADQCQRRGSQRCHEGTSRSKI